MSRVRQKRRVAVRDLRFQHQGGLCCYCEKPMALRNEPTKAAQIRLGLKRKSQVASRRATLEHLKRVADGGTNAPGNLVAACQDCNGHRQDRDWLSWKSIRLGEVSA